MGYIRFSACAEAHFWFRSYKYAFSNNIYVLMLYQLKVRENKTVHPCQDPEQK